MTLTKVWEEAEVEGACKNEERGLTRCRGGSQGTWEMHSSRCQSPHHRRHPGSCRAPTDPTTGPLDPRAIASVSGTAQRDLAVSHHWTIQWTIASFASHRDDRVVEKFHGKGRWIGKKERTKKTSERSATKRTPTLPLGIQCSHRAAFR